MMTFKCHTCSKEFAANQLIGTIPPHIHLNAFCEECFEKISKPSEQKTSCGDMHQ